THLPADRRSIATPVDSFRPVIPPYGDRRLNVRNTIEALDQFTQALGPMLPPPPASATSQHPQPTRAVAPAAPVGPAAAQVQLTAMSRNGITRRAPRGDWVRRARLAVLTLTMILGFSHAVRATERAADRYWRQAVAKSLTAQPHGHPTPSVRHT